MRAPAGRCRRSPISFWVTCVSLTTGIRSTSMPSVRCARWGSSGVAGRFEAMFGSARCQAEGASVYAEIFHRLGYLPVGDLTGPDRTAYCGTCQLTLPSDGCPWSATPPTFAATNPDTGATRSSATPIRSSSQSARPVSPPDRRGLRRRTDPDPLGQSSAMGARLVDRSPPCSRISRTGGHRASRASDLG